LFILLLLLSVLLLFFRYCSGICPQFLCFIFEEHFRIIQAIKFMEFIIKLFLGFSCIIRHEGIV
jgi:hypothetical protein